MSALRPPAFSYRADRTPPSVFGAHQPGIASPQLDHAVLATFDVDALPDVLRAWTAAAEQAMAEGVGTVTIGLGASAFRGPLAAQRPVALRDVPALPGDDLHPGRCGGDAAVLVAAERREGAACVLEALCGAAGAGARPRWSVRGFLPRRDGERRGTPRNLLGFRDGSMNLRRPRDLDRHVWVHRGERTWMLGGTFMVVRRIALDLDRWRALDRAAQERVIGRDRETGAPFGGRREFDPPVLERMPADAHSRLAAPRSNRGAAMLRRSWSYEEDGEAGLLFTAYAQDPARQVVPVARRLAAGDALRAFSRTTGAAVFAVPPGAGAGGFVGEGLVSPVRPAAS